MQRGAMAGQRNKDNEGETIRRTSRALPSRMKVKSRPPPTLPSVALSHADPWLMVQIMLARSGQNEINVDDSNHAVW